MAAVPLSSMVFGSEPTLAMGIYHKCIILEYYCPWSFHNKTLKKDQLSARVEVSALSLFLGRFALIYVMRFKNLIWLAFFPFALVL